MADESTPSAPPPDPPPAQPSAPPPAQPGGDAAAHVEREVSAAGGATAAPTGGPAAGQGAGPATVPANPDAGSAGGIGNALPQGLQSGPAPGGGSNAPGGGTTPPGTGAPAPGDGGTGGGHEGGGAPVVPIDPGQKDDLLHPDPGGPGLASRPAGAEAASAGGHPHPHHVHEQHGEQQVSFGGGHHGGAHPGSAPAVQHVSQAAAPTAPATPAHHDPVPAPPAPAHDAAPPAPRHEPEHHHHHHRPPLHEPEPHGTVTVDPQGLADFARAMSATAEEYRAVASSVRAGEARMGASGEIGERLRIARDALERLADETQEAARDLEMRAGIIHELADEPGVRDADLVSTVFNMKVSPLADPGSHRRP
jgi:hypothetical protein